MFFMQNFFSLSYIVELKKIYVLAPSNIESKLYVLKFSFFRSVTAKIYRVFKRIGKPMHQNKCGTPTLNSPMLFMDIHIIKSMNLKDA
jgi:hypothetical protein